MNYAPIKIIYTYDNYMIQAAAYVDELFAEDNKKSYDYDKEVVWTETRSPTPRLLVSKLMVFDEMTVVFSFSFEMKTLRNKSVQFPGYEVDECYAIVSEPIL